MPLYDLLIQGGELLIPARGIRAKRDVALAHGCVAAIEPAIAASSAVRTISAAGLLVVPGLVDLHTHLGFEVHTRIIDADDTCLPGGVCAAVDMGSAGAFVFPWYRERVLERCQVHLYSFLNIAALGTTAIHTPYYVDNYGRYVDVAEAIRTIEANRQYIRGIKVFTSGAMVGEWALGAIRAAQQVSDAVDLPVAVHVSAKPPELAEVLALLQAGDIMTHTFTPNTQGILDGQGQVLPAVWDARQRGVLFDLGHGNGSFGFEVARRALDQGFMPDTFSSDIYYANIPQPVGDLPNVLSKLLNLGVPLEEVLLRSTSAPARLIGEPALGNLEVGGPGDVALLRLEEGEFGYVDSRKQSLQGRQRLTCQATILGGKVVYQGAA